MCSTLTIEQVKAGWKKIKKRNINPLIIIKFPKDLEENNIRHWQIYVLTETLQCKKRIRVTQWF